VGHFLKRGRSARAKKDCQWQSNDREQRPGYKAQYKTHAFFARNLSGEQAETNAKERDNQAVVLIGFMISR
jgi:hypothetical protein